MVDSIQDEDHRPEPTLAVMLSTAARRFSDTQLVAACGIGVIGAAGFLLLLPALWRFALPMVSLAAFAGWAIAERDGSRRLPIRMLQSAVAIIGTLAAFAFALSLLMPALGIWIS